MIFRLSSKMKKTCMLLVAALWLHIIHRKICDLQREAKLESTVEEEEDIHHSHVKSTLKK